MNGTRTENIANQANQTTGQQSMNRPDLSEARLSSPTLDRKPVTQASKQPTTSVVLLEKLG